MIGTELIDETGLHNGIGSLWIAGQAQCLQTHYLRKDKFEWPLATRFGARSSGTYRRLYVRGQPKTFEEEIFRGV
eukprot:scaffold27384_cov36-Cyclotella_meneghiniana.AAC.2